MTVSKTLDRLARLRRASMMLRASDNRHEDWSFTATAARNTPATLSVVASGVMRQSMSRRGNCWDNAVAESFFGRSHASSDPPPVCGRPRKREDARGVVHGSKEAKEGHAGV
jgi:hypothetical protein